MTTYAIGKRCRTAPSSLWLVLRGTGRDKKYINFLIYTSSLTHEVLIGHLKFECNSTGSRPGRRVLCLSQVMQKQELRFFAVVTPDDGLDD